MFCTAGGRVRAGVSCVCKIRDLCTPGYRIWAAHFELEICDAGSHDFIGIWRWCKSYPFWDGTGDHEYSCCDEGCRRYEFSTAVARGRCGNRRLHAMDALCKAEAEG